MRITTKKTILLAAALGTVAIFGACDRAPDLEVRTFTLQSMRDHEAATLIEPYIYRDREGAAGEMSVMEGAITVRETPDNLERIERVLAEYDKGRPDVRLYFQLIEADGFTGTDERIAAVEEELRKVLQFRGYRLAGEGFVTATDGSSIGHILQAADGSYDIGGEVYWSGPGTIRLDALSMHHREMGGSGLNTTVNIRPGQTLVLGSAPKPGSTATLLLTVRAEEVTGSNQ